MNLFSKRLQESIILLLSLILISSCGSSDDEDVTVYSINASSDSVIFDRFPDDEETKTFELNINFEGDGLLVGIPPDEDLSATSSAVIALINYELNDLTDNSANILVSLPYTASEDSNPLDLGYYNVTLRLSTGNFTTQDLVHHDIEVVYIVHQNQLYARDVFGVDTVDIPETLIIPEGLNWQASTDESWLNLSQTSGTGGEELSVSATVTDIEVPGKYDGKLTLTFEDSESFSTAHAVYHFELALDNPRLFSHLPALSFNNQPSHKTLTHTVNILSNAVTLPLWQATSSVNWLTLTSDTNNNTLTLTIDEAVMLAEGLHDGVITLSALNDESNFEEGTINLAYHTMSTDSAETIIPLSSLATMALHPTQPYLFVLSDNQLTYHHLLTTEEDTNISSSLPDDLTLDSFLLMPSGDNLIVTGTANDDTKYFSIDLTDNIVEAAQEITPTRNEIVGTPVGAINVDGIDVVVTNQIEVANINLERQMQGIGTDDRAFFTERLFYTSTSNELFANNPVNRTIERFTFDANTYSSIESSMTLKESYLNNDFPVANLDFVVNSQADIIYTANEDTEISVYDGSVFSKRGVLYNADDVNSLNVTIDSADNSYFYRIDNSTNEVFITEYDSEVNAKPEVIIPSDNFAVAGGRYLDVLISTAYKRTVTYIANPTSEEGKIIISTIE